MATAVVNDGSDSDGDGVGFKVDVLEWWVWCGVLEREEDRERGRKGGKRDEASKGGREEGKRGVCSTT